MSTKLYNGYRIRSDTYQPLELPKVFRDILQPAADQQWARMMLASAVALHDGHPQLLSPVEPPERASLPLLWVGGEWLASREAKRRSSGLRDPSCDASVDVAVLADPHDSDWTYLLLYCEQSAITEAFRAIGGIEPFPYWDNTDRPEDVTEAEWTQRYAIWNRVLPGYSTPAEMGLCWNYDPSMSWTTILSDIKTHPDKYSHLMPAKRQRATLRAMTSSNATTLAGWREAIDEHVEQAMAELDDLAVQDLLATP